MVDGLFFCATLTGCRESYTPLVQTGAESPDIGSETVKPDPGSSWRDTTGGGMPASGMKRWSLLSLSIHAAFHWWSTQCAGHVLLLSDELMSWCVAGRLKMGVSICGAVHLHSMDGWALSGAGVQDPWHGVLETAWPHCDKAQQVGFLGGWEGCPLVLDAGIRSQFARRPWCRGR